MSEGMQSGKYWRTPGTKEQQERIATLEAYVAALVQAANEMRENFPEGRLQDWEQRLVDVLAAPDLAALVARAEKEQAVIAAARKLVNPSVYLGDFEELHAALAALDTTEP